MANHIFSSIKIPVAQIKNLQSLGLNTMTPIQEQSLPHILKGKDIIARAKTGSGKTAAFGIGLLNNINPHISNVQALVLCPTRELANQIGREIRKLARSVHNIKLVLLCGGITISSQISSMKHSAHIIVGTPGRIQDHLHRKTLKLHNLKTLVLDEADRMLDMGFVEIIYNIISQTPKSRQTLLFSATYPVGINKISHSIQKNPISVEVELEHKTGVIEQIFYQANKYDRNEILLAIFEHFQPKTAIVFCYTKKQCDKIALFLRAHRIQALAIHSDLTQSERDQVLVRFTNNSCLVLVATDVAARGLDIKSLHAVINYELPRDPKIYTHRIGRTGRAGEQGRALSIFTTSEQVRMHAIEYYQNKPCCCDVYESLERNPNFKLQSNIVTIQLDAGRKHKIRPGDILGALTGDAGLICSHIGNIDIFDMSAYVAVNKIALRQAMNYLEHGKVKGRTIRARRI
ncbi:MAG: ATP-dependent RNA helicase DbpA [Piscirickettsiaceae bacterium]|nr:ATP-dependent RNA helicase DbpA [Piscirickettsiaceae bacterium]